MGWDDFICVLGLVLVLEGLPFATFPLKYKDYIRQLLEVPENTLRALGLLAMSCGILLVWLGRM